MKKTFLTFILISLLCTPLSYAEEKSGVTDTASTVESFLLGETNTATETKDTTETTTATATATVTATDTATDTASSTATVTATDTATSTDTASSTTTVTSTSTDSETSSSDSTSNPFSEDKDVNATNSIEAPSIIDIDIAKLCGIEKIEDGYPKDGTVIGVEGTTLRLRSWPWGNVIGNFTNGTKVKVLGVSGEFYLVDINGTQGYMHKNYISTPDAAGSGVDPYYPGDTRNGGALSKEEGVQASKDGAEGKVPTVSSSGGTPGTVTITGDKVVLDVPKNYQGTVNTPAPWSSCGPTSLSMVLGFYGKGDPRVLVTDLYNISGCTRENGTGHDGLARAAKQYGMSNAQWHYSVNQDFCRQKLKEGKPLICHVKGHYVVMKGMDSNGNVILNDPAWNGVERTMSWSDFVAWWKQSNAPMSCMSC